MQRVHVGVPFAGADADPSSPAENGGALGGGHRSVNHVGRDRRRVVGWLGEQGAVADDGLFHGLDEDVPAVSAQ
ncbi:hypothetical protein [Streptomyces formicae]|uniref:hypothetical protein n=1 Tax=Streptomyces formicae TaxID=1616117 RepID=UPI00360ADAEF